MQKNYLIIIFSVTLLLFIQPLCHSQIPILDEDPVVGISTFNFDQSNQGWWQEGLFDGDDSQLSGTCLGYPADSSCSIPCYQDIEAAHHDHEEYGGEIYLDACNGLRLPYRRAGGTYFWDFSSPNLSNYPAWQGISGFSFAFRGKELTDIAYWVWEDDENYREFDLYFQIQPILQYIIPDSSTPKKIAYCNDENNDCICSGDEFRFYSIRRGSDRTETFKSGNEFSDCLLPEGSVLEKIILRLFVDASNQDYDSWFKGTIGFDDITPIPCIDADIDGYNVEGGICGPKDCNDNDNTVFPGADEICDGKDNNCDGQGDTNCCTSNDDCIDSNPCTWDWCENENNQCINEDLFGGGARV